MGPSAYMSVAYKSHRCRSPTIRPLVAGRRLVHPRTPVLRAGTAASDDHSTWVSTDSLVRGFRAVRVISVAPNLSSACRLAMHETQIDAVSQKGNQGKVHNGFPNKHSNDKALV